MAKQHTSSTCKCKANGCHLVGVQTSLRNCGRFFDWPGCASPERGLQLRVPDWRGGDAGVRALPRQSAHTHEKSGSVTSQPALYMTPVDSSRPERAPPAPAGLRGSSVYRTHVISEPEYIPLFVPVCATRYWCTARQGRLHLTSNDILNDYNQHTRSTRETSTWGPECGDAWMEADR